MTETIDTKTYENNPFLGTFTPEQIKKVRERKKLPDGILVPIMIGTVKIKDNETSGKWGLNVAMIPIPALDSPSKDAKRGYTMYGSFLSWFKDPRNKARKVANTFGLFENWVRGAQPTMPSDGSSLPPTAIRDPETDELIHPETKKPLSTDKKQARAMAESMQEAQTAWIQKLYSEYVLAAEQKVKPHPMEGWIAIGKVTYSQGEDGKTYANVGGFRAELPEGEELFDLVKYKPADGEDEDEDESDED